MRKLIVCLMTSICMVVVSSCDVFFPPISSPTAPITEYSYEYVAPTPMPLPEESIVEQTGLFNSLTEAVDFARMINLNSNVTHIVINTGVPLFSNSDFTNANTVYTSDQQGRPTTALTTVTIESIEGDTVYNDIANGDITTYNPPGWSDSKYVRRIPLIGESLCESILSSSIITGTKTLKNSLAGVEQRIIDAVTNNPDISILYRVTPVYTDNNILANGLIVEAYSIEDNGETLSLCEYLVNTQPGRTVNYLTGAIT